MNLYEVMLPKFRGMFSIYNVLLGQVCIKCFERVKDVVASTITIENEVEMDKKEEKDKISVKTAPNVVDKSLELLDCSALKNVKPDRTLQIGERTMVLTAGFRAGLVGLNLG